MREHQSEAKSTSEGTTGTVRPWPAWACPAHQRPLETRDVALACSRGDRYPVEGGIPRFVPGSNYASAFGAQWNRYRLTQLDKHTGLPITRDRFWQAVGAPSGESLTGLQVLECGCGAGRFTEVLLDSGAHVTSVDLSDAVDANAINFPVGDRHRLAQADICALPFLPEQFDVVVCLGVIQHTPSPERTIEALYKQVRPGGRLIIDHYEFALSWYTRAAWPVREVLRRLPAEEGLRATEWIVDSLLPVHRRARKSRLLQTLLARVSPVTTYYYSIPELSEDSAAGMGASRYP